MVDVFFLLIFLMENQWLICIERGDCASFSLRLRPNSLSWNFITESMVLRKYTLPYMIHKNWTRTKWITELNVRNKTIKLL